MHNTNDRCRSFTLNQKRCGETALENMQGGLQTVWFMQHLRLGSWVRNYAYSHSAFFSASHVCVCLLLAHATKSGCFSTLLKKERVKTWSETQQRITSLPLPLPFPLLWPAAAFALALPLPLGCGVALGSGSTASSSTISLDFLFLGELHSCFLNALESI